MYSALLRCTLLIVAGSLIAGCTPKKTAPLSVQETLWATFLQSQNALKLKNHFSIRSSINYTSTQQKHRVIMRLYGNLDYPIRMDIEAGIGRTLSVWREDATTWNAYFPGEHTLYVARDGHTGTQRIGFPNPFNLRELAQILQGDIASILPPGHIPGPMSETGQAILFPPGNRITKLFLDRRGNAIELQGKSGWRVFFDYTDASSYSQKITLRMDMTTQAVIRVKSITETTFTTDLAISTEDTTNRINIEEIAPAGTPTTNGTSLPHLRTQQ